MKIKNSNNSLKLGITVPVAFVCVIVFSVLRAVQMAAFIDSETGFFEGGSAFNVLFYILLAVCCLFFAVVSFLSSDGKKVDLVCLKDKNAAAASIIFAVGLLYDWLDSFFESSAIFGGITEVAYLKRSEAFKLLMSSGALPYALQSVFALLAAIYVFILAKSFLKGTPSAHKHRLLAITPIAWAGFKMITRFVKQISYIKVSDLFLELIMLAFMMMFFVALSQVVSGVYCDDSRWRITAFGFSGAVIALSLNIPRLIFTFISGELINKEYPFSIGDAFFGVFALFIGIAAVKSVKSRIEEK